ncbi:hypothetical protein NA56DRAFT_697294 [Hyaloscypha hepaticicola]|uniref:Uncharacterized protein n=1 Tax=Hyaloscypha hepaticicola TaxID=2082293 RepID=A0A2J6QLH0_9HELO|nr:hypothetical protein NA56DRAFT_697294 [Hyaloscypha hepaticicola]
MPAKEASQNPKSDSKSQSKHRSKDKSNDKDTGSDSLCKYLNDTTHNSPGYRSEGKTEHETVIEARKRAREAIEGYEKRAGR